MLKKKFNFSNKPVSFKKRFEKRASTRSLLFGNSSVCFSKNYRLETIYFFQLQKYLKFILNIKKKKKKRKKLKQIWIFLTKNYPISKKSKNARMGKGKGAFLRLTLRVKKNSNIFEFKNVNAVILKKITSFFKKKFNVETAMFKPNFNDVKILP